MARREEAQDIACLLAVFASLEGDRRSEAMRAAVMELAASRMPSATEDEREAWLIQLATDCLPRGMDAAASIARASDFDLDAIDTLCDGSALTVVLRTSHENAEASAGMVECTQSVRPLAMARLA